MALLALKSCGVGKSLQSTGVLADDSCKGGLASKSLSYMVPTEAWLALTKFRGLEDAGCCSFILNYT